MFTCKDSIDQLLEFLDGEISADDEEHLHEHLSGCPPCVSFLKTYRATPNLARRALGETMPEDFARSLTAFLRERCKKK